MKVIVEALDPLGGPGFISRGPGLGYGIGGSAEATEFSDEVDLVRFLRDRVWSWGITVLDIHSLQEPIHA